MLHVAGQKLVILTDPSQQSAVFKDTNNFVFDPFIKVLYKGIGNVSPEGMRVSWRKPSEGFVSLHPNPKQNPLCHSGNALLHKQLTTPGGLTEVLEYFVYNLHSSLQWNAFWPTSLISEGPEGKDGRKVVSLYRWIRDVVVHAQTETFFGPTLLDLEPAFVEHFEQFDLNSWMVTYQVPDAFARAATEPREKMVRAITQYLDTPRHERKDGRIAFMDECEDEMRQAGLNSEDGARVLFIIIWG